MDEAVHCPAINQKRSDPVHVPDLKVFTAVLMLLVSACGAEHQTPQDTAIDNTLATKEHLMADRAEQYVKLVDEIEKLLPGEGSLATRVATFREQFVIATSRLDAVFSAAIAECRRHWRTGK